MAQERIWSHVQLDGGTTDRREFKSGPEVPGHHEFHPTAPTFYLVAVDEGGFEYMAWIGTDREEGVAMADHFRALHGIKEFVDLTVMARA